MQRTRESFRKRVHRSSRAGRAEKRAERHQKRIAEELAIGAMTGAVGPLLTGQNKQDRSQILAAAKAERLSPFYKDIEPSLALKCDVCVLSTYKHLFLFMDVLLQTGIWSCSVDELSDNSSCNCSLTDSD